MENNTTNETWNKMQNIIEKIMKSTRVLQGIDF
jgi:hypothetical protein